MVIRLVEDKDFSSWVGLRYELWPYHTLQELEDEAREIYSNKETCPVFVVELNGEIIGFIELSIHDSAPGCTTSNIGFIEGWYVKPGYRRTGIGRKLVEAGEAWAFGMGCSEMASDTTERYPVSPLAHRALGYEETGVPLHYKKVIGNAGTLPVT